MSQDKCLIETWETSEFKSFSNTEGWNQPTGQKSCREMPPIYLEPRLFIWVSRIDGRITNIHTLCQTHANVCILVTLDLTYIGY